MAIINYNGKTISDDDIQDVLVKIATHLGPVNVTSGDRNAVPKGGSKTSLHLVHQAVDFWITGMSLEDTFKKLVEKRYLLFNSSHKYEVIWHGPYTITGGAHIHIGRHVIGAGVSFKKEGTTADTKGKYIVF